MTGKRLRREKEGPCCKIGTRRAAPCFPVLSCAGLETADRGVRTAGCGLQIIVSKQPGNLIAW